MEKPIILKIEDFKRNLSKTINSSGLPIYVIHPILRDILFEAGNILNNEIVSEQEKYKMQIEKGAGGSNE